MHFFEKTIERVFNIGTTPFLNCKQMLDYKLNSFSRIEYKCQVSNKLHTDEDKDNIYSLLKLKFFYNIFILFKIKTFF